MNKVVAELLPYKKLFTVVVPAQGLVGAISDLLNFTPSETVHVTYCVVLISICKSFMHFLSFAINFCATFTKILYIEVLVIIFPYISN